MDSLSSGRSIPTDSGSMMLWYANQMAQWERQVERRQLFLKSYQFSAPSPAPRTFSKRLGRSLVQARRLVWSRLRCLPRLVWSTLRRRGGTRKWARLAVLPKGNEYYRPKRVMQCNSVNHLLLTELNRYYPSCRRARLAVFPSVVAFSKGP